ncbi:hypothetical protein Tco_0139470 [Tanacetum coccineum]
MIVYPLFQVVSDPEDQFEEEETKAVREPTMEEYITITRLNYESGNKKGMVELKGRFLLELQNNASSGTNGEDAIEHVENFLKVVDLIKIPIVSDNQLRVHVFPFSLTGVLNRWWEDESIGLIATLVDLTEKNFMKFYPPSRINRKIEVNEAKTKIEDGYCNLGDLPRLIREDNLIHYQDYEWYDTIEDSDLKEEALINKIVLYGSINAEEESSEDVCQIIIIHNETQERQGRFGEHELIEDSDNNIRNIVDYLIRKDSPYYANEDEEKFKEQRCKLLGIPYAKPPTCKYEKFEVIKYSFGLAKEYVAIKEYEYDIWV